MAKKKKITSGVPLQNGTGGGVRANKGRGGCAPSKRPKKGKGR